MSPKLLPAQRKPFSNPNQRWVVLKLLPSWTTKRLLQPLVGWKRRERWDSSQELSPSEKSRSIRRLPRCFFQELLSTDSSDQFVVDSIKIFGSSLKLWLLSKSQLRPTSLEFSRIPTCVPSMPTESPSWRRIWISQEESEETNFAISLTAFQKPEMRHFMNSHTSIALREWKISKMLKASELTTHSEK